MTHDTITISPGSRFRAAMMLVIIADALQIVVFPLFVEGALSPADDILDGVRGVPLDMSRIHPECPDSADVLLRQEPAEEEEEDEGDGKEDDDDDDTDDGYSE